MSALKSPWRDAADLRGVKIYGELELDLGGWDRRCVHDYHIALHWAQAHPELASSQTRLDATLLILVRCTSKFAYLRGQ